MEGLLDPGNNREEGDGIPIQIILVLKDGWTPPPSRGLPIQLSLGDWTPLSPIVLGYLDPSWVDGPPP